ncbi:hypothetical protein [Methylobacterium sp. P5_C11]
MGRLLSMVLLVLAGSARAADFTGFYAGINAGYGRGSAHDRRVSAPATGGASTFAGAQSGPDLPPSARDAAATLRTVKTARAPGTLGR